jgi:hypothetical protein
MEHFDCEENDALKMFYESHTGKCYADDATGLYGQSALYVFSLFCEDVHTMHGDKPRVVSKLF